MADYRSWLAMVSSTRLCVSGGQGKSRKIFFVNSCTQSKDPLNRLVPNMNPNTLIINDTYKLYSTIYTISVTYNIYTVGLMTCL